MLDAKTIDGPSPWLIYAMRTSSRVVAYFIAEGMAATAGFYGVPNERATGAGSSSERIKSRWRILLSRLGGRDSSAFARLRRDKNHDNVVRSHV